MTNWKRVAALTTLVLAAAAGMVAAAVLYIGWYDVSATQPHMAPAHRIFDIAARQSIRARVQDIQVPDLDAEGRAVSGFKLFRAHCVQCHGAPGLAPEPFARGMMPAPSALAGSAREWSAPEIYQAIRNGIKMTGMPAWKYRLDDDEIWDLVAFIKVLPTLSPADYQRWARQYPGSPDTRAAASHAGVPIQDVRLGDAGAGRQALHQYLCTTCHAIPGVVGADRHVGPPLGGMADRLYIAGVLPNTPANMVHWLRYPTQVDPQSAMPDLGVTEQDARDIAAFLYTLRDDK
ncbi:c-type cytochrome [Bordetella bronchialis]|uniref:Cytochrome C n=1 Tax=Bordetella bronchialis TaxID=463025 RepID=A0ABM6CMY4_9BORD|nr:c-type cytochrome [Bordetella bronchialis]ANN65247.1 cytochrome C [Bordetella bronchialis]